MVRKLVLALSVTLLALHSSGCRREVKHPPGILIAGQPVQTSMGKSVGWEERGYRITPLARFSLQARVIGVEGYWFDRGADLSPIDFVLGWGPMSDSKILDELTITQGGRWYRWRPKEFPPVPVETIVSHSANMHMVPADDKVARLLKSVRPGNVVALGGYLIAVEAKDGWRWQSSLSRGDSGGGACELVWVKSLMIDQRPGTQSTLSSSTDFD